MWGELDIPDRGKERFTDYSRWRLRTDNGGMHVWSYLQEDRQLAEWPQTDVDRYWLGLPVDAPTLPTPSTPLEAARNGLTFYKRLQTDDGHWPGEYGGPLFLMPGLVIGSYVTGMTFTLEERKEMIRYLMNRAHPDDGGWGLHIEGPSTAFGTSLNYVAIRLLGLPAEHPVCVRARGTLHKLGGAAAAPSWAKLWLAVLGVYDWSGLNSVPPEFILLPEWVPMHPHRWWIHTRTVYIPMAYLYGVRFTHPEDKITLALRDEIYVENYYKIYWPNQRNNVSEVDIYAPHSKLMDGINMVLSLYEGCVFPPLRKWGLDEIYHHIVMEDENTGFQTLGPVSKMLNAIARWHKEGPDSVAHRRHDIKRRDFMWLGAEGMMMCGTNGSQLWDAGFIASAMADTGLAKERENVECMTKLYRWLDGCQMTANPVHFEHSHRHPTKGAWPFSTKEQGYTVSDCTGEGLKAVLYMEEQLPDQVPRIDPSRLRDAVDIILSLQNSGGGFASYEPIRGPAWLESLNPAEVFGNIMVEYNYPECTTSAITALATYRNKYLDYRSRDIENTIRKAVIYLKKAQDPCGGWFGSWGICFTYATQFALESLSLVGETYSNSDYARRACDFLVGKQRADGGWGESYHTCEVGYWVEHAETQVVQTAWATLALMYAKYPDPAPIRAAVAMVMRRQRPDGRWEQEAIEGVFNKSCAISYPNFKFSFTIWMLGIADAYLRDSEKSPLSKSQIMRA